MSQTPDFFCLRTRVQTLFGLSKLYHLLDDLLQDSLRCCDDLLHEDLLRELLQEMLHESLQDPLQELLHAGFWVGFWAGFWEGLLDDWAGFWEGLFDDDGLGGGLWPARSCASRSSISSSCRSKCRTLRSL
jgi:hypothetical protein